MSNSYSIVLLKGETDNDSYMGIIKEGKPGLEWYKGNKEEGLKVISEDNVIDLIKMGKIDPSMKKLIKDLSKGLYLKEGNEKNFKKVDNFILMLEKVNGKLVGDITDVNMGDPSPAPTSNNNKPQATNMKLDPNSAYVIAKNEDKIYVGEIKERRPDLQWYKGDIKEGKVFINRDNVFDLIEMKEIEPKHAEDFEYALCYNRKQKDCEDNKLANGLYLKETGKKAELEKVENFTINFNEGKGYIADKSYLNLLTENEKPSPREEQNNVNVFRSIGNALRTLKPLFR